MTGRTFPYISERQRLIVLTFDTPADAAKWDELGDDVDKAAQMVALMMLNCWRADEPDLVR